ncbi:MAG: hypothetical protein JWN00_3380 [Actinomycetia bacterium]|nr:hypothetical protein [Actinomycetes bacterium]
MTIQILSSAATAVLDLAAEIAPWTIEKVLTKSDLQLGIKALLGPYGYGENG